MTARQTTAKTTTTQKTNAKAASKKKTTSPAKKKKASDIKAERVQSKIKAERVQSKLAGMRNWRYVESDNVIRRQYQFPSFLASIRFVAWVAELAEAADHHPDLDIRYNKVVVSLATHSAGGITEKDFALARQIDHL